MRVCSVWLRSRHSRAICESLCYYLERQWILANKHFRICILRGCSVPVILRECDEGEVPSYKIIGEAFVHRMMDGQALTLGKDWVKYVIN